MARTNDRDRTADMPAVRFTPLKLSGSAYQLAFKFNALCEAEKLTGENLLQGLGRLINGGMTAAQYRAVLYASLRMAHPKLTLEDAGDLIESAFADGTISDIREALLTTHYVSFEKTVPPVADPPAENSGA